MGRCECGDSECPSCGPMQGSEPGRRKILDWLASELEIPDSIDVEWLTDFIATKVLPLSAEMQATAERAALEWSNAEAKRLRVSRGARQ